MLDKRRRLVGGHPPGEQPGPTPDRPRRKIQEWSRAMGYTGYTVEIDIDGVFIHEGRRPAEKERVDALAESMRELGQLEAIVVDEDHRLIAGLHRIEAAKSLGWKTIHATVLDLYGLRAELAEIDENLIRSELPKALYVTQLARRKAIYEELHPASTKGGDHRSEKSKRKNGALISEPSFTPSFTEDTAAKTGRSQRRIQVDVAIGEGLDQEAADTIATTPAGDSQKQLRELASLPPAEQRKVASEIKSGKVKSVAELTSDSAESYRREEIAQAKKAIVALGVVTRALDYFGAFDAHGKAVERIKVFFASKLP